jgi:hypothetical protein
MPEIEIPEPSPRTRTTLVKLCAWQCRYVVSDDGPEAIFCGGSTEEGASWCPWHRRLVYTRPPGPGSKKTIVRLPNPIFEVPSVSITSWAWTAYSAISNALPKSPIVAIESSYLGR